MPGEKRKGDEEIWWPNRQLKKLRYSGQILSDVYELTLAKLANGARFFFSSPPSERLIGPITPTFPSGSGSQGHSGSNGDLARMCESCSSCISSSSRFPVDYESCNYCDIRICHLNECSRCGVGFCGACCIQRYDGNDPFSDGFVCLNCL